MVVVQCSPHAAPRAVIVSQSERLVETASFDLIPAYRLHTGDEFSAVFSFRRVVRGKVFNLHYRPNALPSARIGFVVAKKLARQAVQRNLIKRIAREAFRLRRATLPCCDLVLRLSASPKATSRAALRLEVDALFDRLPQG
ncbi:ribonuclease P protein component [Niveibacterium sp. 24ML]|uniref:ribonuclease P protein component n=1 Tax=Niveibacterium sp. 24ML TaxID=2985512 RepID=UPI002270D0F5|nr:ribonuclease P protein component [Niveibacterium sp. 24ML]MCX9155631.1 ribonuclease P protein component [Niveibacterium sp. 24ML]